MEQETQDNLQYNYVLSLIFIKKAEFNYSEEDIKLIKKLWESYCRKRKGLSRTSANVWAASILWLHSRLNFLWEYDKAWTQKLIGEVFDVRPKTIGDKCREITNILKIKDWDDRFCRKEIAESNPLKNMVMLESGFILTREQAIQKSLPFMPLKKSKEDYFYDAHEHIGKDNEKAIRCFKKALEMDGEYVDAYNGLGSVYFWDNISKSKEYYSKAFELSRKHFKDKWPKRIEWGILENRQYLRSMHGYGLLLWREGKSDEAMALFKLALKLNPNDNQGMRYIVAAIYKGLTWEQYGEIEDKAMKTFNYEEEEKLLEEQNKIHKFF